LANAAPNDPMHTAYTAHTAADLSVSADESDNTMQWIWKAVSIWQESQSVMNRDESTTYQLSQIYDNLLLSVVTSHRERTSVWQSQQLMLKFY